MSMTGDLHAALVAALRADDDLMALLGGPDRVREAVPDRRRLPMIVIGALEASDWSGANAPGAEILLTLDIWSRADNRTQIHALCAATEIAIEAMPTQHGDSRFVLVALAATDIVRTRNERAVRAVQRYRVLAEPAQD